MADNFKLGRNRPTALVRSFHLENYLMKTYPAPPPSDDWTAAAIPSLKKIYLNDIEGCCVISCGGHVEGVLTGNSTGVPIIYTDAQINQQYSAIGGYNGTPETDNGCDEQTALNYWQQNGFAGGTKFAGWIRVNGANPTETRSAINLFGNLVFGIPLPDAWINPFPSQNDFVWDTVGPANQNNGHCFGGFGYIPGRIKISTWGMTGWITDAAVAEYTANTLGGELYTILSEDWLSKVTTLSPSGFDWSQLQADLQAIA